MKILSKIYSVFASFLLRFFLFLQFFLLLRLLLKFLAANPQTLVVSLIYKYSDVLISPFNFIFNDVYLLNRLIETSTISAMTGYAVVMFIIAKLLRLYHREY